MPELGLHFVGITEQKVRRSSFGAKMAFRAIAMEARVRRGHRRLEAVAAGRVGVLGARRASGRHAGNVEAAPRAGRSTQAAQHRRHQARAAEGQGVETVELAREPVARQFVDRVSRRCKIVEHDNAGGPVAIAPAQFDALERVAVRAARMHAAAQRRDQRHALRAARIETPRVEIEVPQRRLAVDLEAIDRTPGQRGPDHEQSAFERYAAVGRRRRRRAAELDALACAHRRRSLDLARTPVGPACRARSLRSLEQRMVEALHIRFGDEIGEADDKSRHVVAFGDAPDFQRRTRQQRIERGGDMRKARTIAKGDRR